VIGRTLRWASSLLVRRPWPRGAALTIVRHHRVYADGERPLYRLGVAEGVLRAQLALLRREGLVPVTVSEGLARLAEGRPGHHVALTFDDGYADNVTRALPILAGAGARATFFLTAGLIEARRAPWWDELAHALETARAPAVPFAGTTLELGDAAARARALRLLLPGLRAAPATQRALLDGLRAALGVADPAPCELATWEECRRLSAAGMEIGAHTLTHPFLSTLPPGAQREEVAGSFGLVEERLGARPRGIAFPGGDHDADSLEAARDAGAAWAVTTRAGVNGPGADPFTLRRRAWTDGACLGPGGRFSERLARAELAGAFDAWRARPAGAEAAP